MSRDKVLAAPAIKKRRIAINSWLFADPTDTADAPTVETTPDHPDTGIPILEDGGDLQFCPMPKFEFSCTTCIDFHSSPIIHPSSLVLSISAESLEHVKSMLQVIPHDSNEQKHVTKDERAWPPFLHPSSSSCYLDRINRSLMSTTISPKDTGSIQFEVKDETTMRIEWEKELSLDAWVDLPLILAKP